MQNTSTNTMPAAFPRSRSKVFSNWGKKIGHGLLLGLSPLTRSRKAQSVLSSAESFLAALQGKGASSGWDSKGQVSALVRHVAPGDPLVILDVGANNGDWALALRKALPEHDAVFHLFECAPYCFTPLAKRRPHIGEHVLVKKAVSDRAGEATLFLPDLETGGSGLASLHARHDTSVRQHQYRELKVETITLDDYAREARIDHIDILKVDVEGHEFAVFKGALGLLREGRIATVMFETGSANVNSRTFFAEFWELFHDLGYRLERILPGGETIEIPEYSDSDEYFRGCSNYIAVNDTVQRQPPNPRRRPDA